MLKGIGLPHSMAIIRLNTPDRVDKEAVPMAVYKLFGSGGGSDRKNPPDDDPHDLHYREIPIVEEEDPFQDQSEQIKKIFQQFSNSRGSIVFRFAFFGLSWIALFFVFMNAALTLFMAGLALMSLSLSSSLNQGFKKCWNDTKRWCAIMTGSVVGIFTPPMGLAFILVYFMLRSSSGSKGGIFDAFERKFDGVLRDHLRKY